MSKSVSFPGSRKRWRSLWIVALLSLLGQLWICQFFSFGQQVPMSIDINPSNLWKFGYQFPPTGWFLVLNWLGVAYLPPPLNPFSVAAHLAPWWFFTTYAPVMATLALLAMAAFLRELELPRPAALFGGVIFAWQGDLLPFVFPGHFGYIGTWPFFAIAAWGALRAERTRHWAYALMSGTGCGLMVGLQPDRGGIASLLIAALYAAPVQSQPAAGRTLLDYLRGLRYLALCAGAALLVSLAPLLALFQGNIVGVKLGGRTNRNEVYKFVTQFSLGPEETLTYLVPGFFGWHSSDNDGPYWGEIGRTLDWPKNTEGTRNFNLAISTTGTVATVLALIGVGLLLPGSLLGRSRFSERQFFYGRVLLGAGFVALVFSWGWHTSFYRLLFALPLMDKWRDPLKWLEMTNFALVVLSAFGVQHLMASLDSGRAETQSVRQRLTWFTGGMLILLGLGLMASYPFAIVLAARLQTEGYEVPAIANIMSTLHMSLEVALVLMGLFCLLLHALWRPEPLRGWTLDNPLLNRIWQAMLRPDYLALTLALGLTLLSVMQLGWVADQFLETNSLKELTQDNPILDALSHEGDRVRCSVAVEDPALSMLVLNQFNSRDISCLDISAASRYPDDISTFLYGPLKDHQARLWFLAGVKNIVVPQQFMPQLRQNADIAANIDHADGYTIEQTTSPNLPSHAVVAMRDYLAKATLVPHAEFFPTDRALLQRLADPNWNPRASILLTARPKEEPEGGGDTIGTPDTVGVDLQTYTPNDITLQVQTDGRGYYVLINDQFDPDWQVQVNGHGAELLRANYIMRAIQVPPGSSTITMHYASRYHVGDMVQQMTGIPVGDLAFSAAMVNIFSDGAMLAAWGMAGFALWRRKSR